MLDDGLEVCLEAGYRDMLGCSGQAGVISAEEDGLYWSVVVVGRVQYRTISRTLAVCSVGKNLGYIFTACAVVYPLQLLEGSDTGLLWHT